jgi:hypothetical protein
MPSPQTFTLSWSGLPRNAVDFLFLNHLHQIELEDVDSRLERCQVSEDKAAMPAAGLHVG